MPGILTGRVSRLGSSADPVLLTMPFVGGFCGALPGAGRTTLLLAVARALVRLPQHLRLVISESGAKGAIRERLRLPEGPTLEELVRGAPGWEGAVQPTHLGFYLLAAPKDHRILPPVSIDQIEWVVRELRAYFDVILFDHGSDLGTMPDSHLLRSLSERLVVVLPATLTGAEGAAHTLRFLQEARGAEWLRRRVVVVLNRVDEGNRLEARVLRRWLEPRVAAVISMPYEPGLASGREDPKLSGEGRRAVAAIAHALRRGSGEGTGPSRML